ncbi:MAG: undecaprenyl-phosphate glucose phosphotransferase [Chloroflexota bacterium]|nr:undecaprenyl-phosphate glucose phosphotransferase [Chloroflexota bacterium]
MGFRERNKAANGTRASTPVAVHTPTPVPQARAVSRAVATEPQRANGGASGVNIARPLTSVEAEQMARQARAERARRTAPLPAEGRAIPALPPRPRSPARLTPVILVLVQMLLDLVGIVGAFLLAYNLRRDSTFLPDPTLYVTFLGITMALMLPTFYVRKLYNLKRGASRVDDIYKIVVGVSLGVVLSIAATYLMLADAFLYSRQVLLTGWILAIILVTLFRVVYSVVIGELRKRGLDRSRVLVVGTSHNAAMVVDRLSWHTTLGYKVVGLVKSEWGEGERSYALERAPLLGNIEQLAEIVRREKVDEVIVALSGASGKQVRHVLDQIKDESVSVKIYPDAFQLMTQNEVSVGELSGLPLLSVKDVTLRGWNRMVKRAFDVVMSAAVLVLTAPVLVALAGLVKLSSPGPVFFIQERVGLDGRPFMLVKFRTMRVSPREDSSLTLGEGLPGWTVRNDPRRTRIGSFLRRFSLDELPQFYNVLVGEMSIVGPRPEQPEYVQEFARVIRGYLRRHHEKAGITGWAQVNGLRGDSSIEDRTRADLYYVENWSLLFDLKIIVRTVVAMFRGKNAY